MTRNRTGRRTAVLFGVMAALALPAAASAQVPGLPPGTIPPGTLPPEAEDAIGTVLTEVINFHVDGIAEQHSQPGHSYGSAVELPGVITVGRSETTPTTSRVTVLRVLDQDLLTREGNATGGTYGGQLAQVGPVIDQINALGCPRGYPAPAGTDCVLVLYSNATSTSNATGTSTNNTAAFKLAVVKLNNGDGVEVLPTSARTSRVRFFGQNRCTDIATAFILTGSGQLAPVSLVGLVPGIGIGGILAPC
jgi:hypothetical protein